MELLGFLLVCLSLFRVIAATSGQEIAKYFHAVLSPGSSVYVSAGGNSTKNVTERWDTYLTSTYAVVVQPALITDVQKVVRYAARRNVPLLTTGGGHGSLDTLNNFQNGIGLDMANFNSISIDEDANTMTVGGSVRFARATEALQAAGKEMPVVSCSCVGMLGATLGGGIGPYASMYGVVSDQLLSVEMVTGAGEIVHVSASKHPELLWALKGAGSNFGVVTSATYAVHPATNGGMSTNADMIFPAAMNASVWSELKSIASDQPKELHMTAGISFNSTMNSAFIIVNAIYAGPIPALEKAIAPLLALQPFNLNVSSVPWKDLGSAAIYGLVARGCTPQGETEYAVNLAQLDLSLLSDLTALVATSLAASPALQATLLAFTFIGTHGVRSFPQSSSAFPWRNVAAFLQLQGNGATAETGPAIEAYGRQIRAMALERAGTDDLQVYVNYAHGDEGEAAWFGKQNVEKLRFLKARYDPWGLFGFYAPISTGKVLGYGGHWDHD